MAKYRVRRTIERDCCSGLYFYWVRLQKKIPLLPLHRTIKGKSGCTYDRSEAHYFVDVYRNELMDEWNRLMDEEEAALTA